MGFFAFASLMIGLILILRIGQSTIGVDLQYNSALSGAAVWDSWGCIHDITGPELTATSVDASCLNSEDGWKEFVTGMKDGGEVTFTMVTQYGEAMNETPGALAVCQQWRISVPMIDCGSANPDLAWFITFNGFITRIGMRFEYDGVQMQDWTIKVTGPVVMSAPAEL